MSKKFLYLFKEGHDAFGGDQTTMKNTLGGKGAGLAEMTHAGMPVPQGFTITTEACTQYYADNREINDEIKADIFKYMGILEEQTGKTFGSIENPLLVSVRSGARQSMPGMMDTILNLGLNDEAVEGLAKKTNNPRFAYDCYRRFVQMFADVVMMVPKSLFEVEIDKMKEAKGVKNDVDLTADDLKELVGTFKKIYEENEGRPFPQDPRDQLIEAVKAVFRSWDNPRANVYRKMNEIPYEWGTAVNVQQMAFGNSGDRSGTGVAFTRDPATGAKKLMGEYLINAQGEDVVAGVRTPSPISHLKDQMPEVYDQFVEIATRLENYFRDMQDMEFTIEDGHLYMLQTRNGKRTAQAALQIACDLVDEGMITEQEAVLRVEPKQLDTLLHPQFDAAALKAAEVVGKGLAASPGSACGQIVFTAEEAEEMVKSGKMKKVVLVRLETSPEDIVGMQVSQGILTVRGGMTSHAAVVARGMGTCCVSGCGNDNDGKIEYAIKVAKTFGKIGTVSEDDFYFSKKADGAVVNGTYDFEDAETYEGLKKNDYVFAYENAALDKIIVEKAAMEEGKVRGMRGDSFNIAGTYYDIADAYTADAMEIGSTYEFYTDGKYVVFAEEVESETPTNFALIKSLDVATSFGDNTWYARVLLNDGTSKDYELKDNKIDGVELKGSSDNDIANYTRTYGDKIGRAHV